MGEHIDRLDIRHTICAVEKWKVTRLCGRITTYIYDYRRTCLKYDFDYILVFYQTNSAQAYELYKVARKFAGLDSNNNEETKPLVYDLYTGTGTIANFVARAARQVIGIEYVEEAIEDARLNASVNGLDNTLFYAGDMKEILTDGFICSHGKPDVMIIDRVDPEF